MTSDDFAGQRNQNGNHDNSMYLYKCTDLLTGLIPRSTQERDRQEQSFQKKKKIIIIINKKRNKGGIERSWR